MLLPLPVVVSVAHACTLLATEVILAATHGRILHLTF